MGNTTEFNTNKVKGLMAENGMTQADVAKSIKKSEFTLRNKLQGKTEFTATEIASIADLFRVSPDIFFTQKLSKIESQKETYKS